MFRHRLDFQVPPTPGRFSALGSASRRFDTPASVLGRPHHLCYVCRAIALLAPKSCPTMKHSPCESEPESSTRTLRQVTSMSHLSVPCSAPMVSLADSPAASMCSVAAGPLAKLTWRAGPLGWHPRSAASLWPCGRGRGELNITGQGAASSAAAMHLARLQAPIRRPTAASLCPLNSRSSLRAVARLDMSRCPAALVNLMESRLSSDERAPARSLHQSLLHLVFHALSRLSHQITANLLLHDQAG